MRELPCPTVAQGIASTGASRSRPYKLRDAVLAALPSLQRPVGPPAGASALNPARHRVRLRGAVITFAQPPRLRLRLLAAADEILGHGRPRALHRRRRATNPCDAPRAYPERQDAVRAIVAPHVVLTGQLGSGPSGCAGATVERGIAGSCRATATRVLRHRTTRAARRQGAEKRSMARRASPRIRAALPCRTAAEKLLRACARMSANRTGSTPGHERLKGRNLSLAVSLHFGVPREWFFPSPKPSGTMGALRSRHATQRLRRDIGHPFWRAGLRPRRASSTPGPTVRERTTRGRNRRRAEQRMVQEPTGR